MLRDALPYPLRGEASQETLLVGTILAVATGLLVRLGVLALLAVVPVVLLVGYALAVLRTTVEGKADPPKFADLRKLGADGVRALVVTIGYLAVPAVALAVTVRGASLGGRPATLETAAVVFGSGMVVLVVSMSFAYLLPAALAEVARTDRLRSAVDRGRLRRAVIDTSYLVGWVETLFVSSIAIAVLVGLAALGRPGEVAALALGFYALVVVVRLFGRATV